MYTYIDTSIFEHIYCYWDDLDSDATHLGLVFLQKRDGNRLKSEYMYMYIYTYICIYVCIDIDI